MRGLLTTQSQNCYREQIRKEMLTRLAWKGRYARHYPTCCNPRSDGTQSTQPAAPAPPVLPADPRAVLLPDIRSPGKQSAPPPPPPPAGSTEGEEQQQQQQQQQGVPPLMRPVSPHTRHTLFQDSTHQGRGRSLYLQRRGQIKPEEKFDFPLLSSWEYGWRLGDYSVDYKTPSRARSSVVKNTFYARNGVFSSPALEV